VGEFAAYSFCELYCFSNRRLLMKIKNIPNDWRFKTKLFFHFFYFFNESVDWAQNIFDQLPLPPCYGQTVK